MNALLKTLRICNLAALWRKSLAGQFIALLLLGLVAAQGLTMLISMDDQQKAFKEMATAEFVSRTATLSRLVETMPDRMRAEVLSAGGTGYTRFWTTPSEPLDLAAFKAEAIRQLGTPLPGIIALSEAGYRKFEDGGEFSLALQNSLDPLREAPLPAAWNRMDPQSERLPFNAKYVDLAPAYGMGTAVPLSDGSWLNAAYYKSYPSPFWNLQTLSSLGLTALLLSALGIFIARRTAQPLRQLARSADALGRGEAVERLSECGPDDLRRTSTAFNRMQERLTRFVADRTRMLAAISHDLRTPLTSLRLRAEYITDEALREKVLETVAEMQAMTEATLSFAKEEAAVEETRAVELCSVVESLCEDLVELGQEVEFEGQKIAYRCRPDALRRALRNLIENAVRYGGGARVALRGTAGGVEITVADSGPGIPENMREQVFSPFFRLETSRNRQTGGSGLGLAIARAIVRHHGGDIRLEDNRPGLLVTVALPEHAGRTRDAPERGLASRLRRIRGRVGEEPAAAAS